jgi:hypothetical protein
MNASQIADQAIAKIEQEEIKDAPVVEEPKKPIAPKDNTTDKDKKDESKPADDKKADEEEGKFTADDALEVDAPKTPDTPTDNAGIQLSTAEQKHIADNIGEPIVIRGIQGEGDNAKEVEIKAYSPGDIPANFKFANDQQLAAATTGFQRLESKATELLGAYRNNQSQTVAQDFEKRENEGIRLDVADLQKDGRFPKFKVQPGATGFDDDPAAKDMAEVLTVMTERNELYLKQYNQGRPYKHIGFSEAFELWEAKNPDRIAAKKTDADQKKEDSDRKATAERSESNRGTNATRVVKPTVRSGTTIADILNAHEQD